MTDTQQKCFLAVAYHLSFSKAASTLYISQPAISKNITALENELGVALFIRQGKNVDLTRAGKIFYDFLTEYDREYRTTLERIRSLDRDIYSGPITIGCGLTWSGARFYTRLSRHFSMHYPNISLNVQGLEPDCLLSALRSKEVDVLIMYANDVKKQPDICSVPFISIGCGFLFSALTPLRNVDRPELSDLAYQDFLVLDSATERSSKLVYTRLITELCKAHGFTPQLRRKKNMSSALVDISCGNGVLLVDDWTAAVNNSELRYLPVDHRQELCLAYLANSDNPSVRFFADETCRVFNDEI